MRRYFGEIPFVTHSNFSDVVTRVMTFVRRIDRKVGRSLTLMRLSSATERGGKIK